MRRFLCNHYIILITTSKTNLNSTQGNIMNDLIEPAGTLAWFLEAVQSNSEAWDGSWADWQNLAHLEDCFSVKFSDPDVSRAAAERIIKRLIVTDGLTLHDE